ncbi:MAG: hypothetical protein Kow0090_14740 [Myxococcota bacterium]
MGSLYSNFFSSTNGVYAAFAVILFLSSALLSAPVVSAEPIETEEGLPPQAISTNDKPLYELKQASYKHGIERIVLVAGKRKESKINVQVIKDGVPQSGERVLFRIISAPKGSANAILSSDYAISDESGFAAVSVAAGDKVGTYLIGAYLRGSVEYAPPVVTRITALSPWWVAFLAFGLLGGLGLFIYGMNLAGDNLQRAAGGRMRAMLGRLTKNRVRAVIAGTLASAILQSSSATTVLLVGFVGATMMTLRQAIGATMGAKIGTTITVQLIAFDIAAYSLAIIAVGFLLMMLGSRKRIKQGGVIILGFGLVFFGMSVMGNAMRPLKGMPEFAAFVLRFSENPFMGVLSGALITALIQSSAATIGLALTFASQNIMSLEGAVQICLGAAIGTTSTALLASIGAPREAKQVALAHLLYSLLAVSIFYPFLNPFIELTKRFTSLLGTDAVERQIANGYMLFSIIAALIFLPFVSLLEKLVRKIIPTSGKSAPFGAIFLNESALSVPLLALMQAQKEIIRMAHIFGNSLKRAMEVIEKGDEEEVMALIREDDYLDTLEKAIRPFLAKVAQRELTHEAAARERALVFITEHIEGAGDILSKEVLRAGEKLAQMKIRFSEEGLKELKEFHEKVIQKYEAVERLLLNHDKALAEQVIQQSFKEALFERKLRESHLARLHSGAVETLESSAAHLSILAGLNDISERLTKIAEEIVRET